MAHSSVESGKGEVSSFECRTAGVREEMVIISHGWSTRQSVEPECYPALPSCAVSVG